MAYPNFVHGEHTVTGVEGDDAGVTVVVRRPDGSSARIDACYVVGCDGVHSTVRQQAGIGFAGSRYAESFALADGPILTSRFAAEPLYDVMLGWDADDPPPGWQAARDRYYRINAVRMSSSLIAFALLTAALAQPTP